MSLDNGIKELTQDQMLYLFRFFKEHADICSVCENRIECNEEECPDYEFYTSTIYGCDGAPATDVTLTCLDSDYGSCKHLKDTPCGTCITENEWGVNFIWNGQPAELI